MSEVTCTETITEWCEHPTNGNKGRLLRYKETGVYVLMLGGTINSVPQRWAAEIHAAKVSPEKGSSPPW